MLTIEIINDQTGDIIEGNYDFRVKINNNTIHVGRIESHNRLSGWTGLISCLNRAVNGDKYDN